MNFLFMKKKYYIVFFFFFFFTKVLEYYNDISILSTWFLKHNMRVCDWSNGFWHFSFVRLVNVCLIYTKVFLVIFHNITFFTISINILQDQINSDLFQKHKKSFRPQNVEHKYKWQFDYVCCLYIRSWLRRTGIRYYIMGWLPPPLWLLCTSSPSWLLETMSCSTCWWLS